MPKNLKSISAINAAVAIRNGLKPGDLRKQNRARHISHPRFEVMAKAHKEGFSLGQIGMFYGGMDHTSVLHGINRHAELTGAAQ